MSTVTCAGHISRTSHSIVPISFATSLHISTAGPGTLKFYNFFTYSISPNPASRMGFEAEFVEVEYVKKS